MPTIDPYTYTPTGWICPKCGNVYSPTISECYKCNTTYQYVYTEPNAKPSEQIHVIMCKNCYYMNTVPADIEGVVYCASCGTELEF